MPPSPPTHTADASLTFEVYDSFDTLPFGREVWDGLVIAAGGEIYQTMEWSRVWWKHHGSGRTLQILVFLEGNRPVALFAGFIESLGWGPFRVRAAKEVCSDYTMGTLVPLVREDLAETWANRILSHFLQDERCDLVRFGVYAGPNPATACLEALEKSNPEWEMVRLPHGTEALLHLPETFEDYLGGLSRNHRTNFRRSVNRLEREVGFEFGVAESPDEACALFDRFVDLHAEQWRALGESGHFGDWPGALDYHRDMVKVQSELGRVHFMLGMAGGEVVSAQYCYGVGGQLSWLLPARKMGDDWEKFGLGRVGFVDMVEQAIRRGYRTLHLGGAYWRYKSDLGGVEESAESVVVSKSGAGAGRTRRLLLVQRLLHFVYYKIWFKRIAPRLPLKRGPLWRTWIRWRL